jgi:lysozyme
MFFMQVSSKGIKLVEEFEGFLELAYLDAVGIWTVGFGETRLDGRPVRQGDRLTLKEARARLAARLDQDFGPAVERAVSPATLAQHQFDACCSLAYNIGNGKQFGPISGAGGFRGSTVARLIRAGDLEGAADAFLMWNKAGGRVLAGLVARRQRERRVFLGLE